MSIGQSAEFGRRNRGKWFSHATACAAALALAFLSNGTAAFADPIRTVTSGGVFQIPEDGETGFDLFGAGFTFSGDAVQLVSPPLTLSCGAPCTPGTSMNLSATMVPSAGGSATLDGHTYDSVYYTGEFRFDAGDVIVPDLAVGESMRPGPTTGFTFTGTLSAYADPGLTGMPLFTTALTGRGTANVGFFNFAASPGLHADGFDFRFENTAATPEPGSLLLLGSGAAWIGSRWRRRRANLRR